MASKGGSKSQKRFAAPEIRLENPKEGKWTIKSSPGPFNAKESVPLGFVLRDLVKLGRNLREIKIALLEGKVSVNGKTRKDYRYPVGFFDVVSVEGKKKDYRTVYDLKGRLKTEEIEKKKKKTKICKIKGKKAAKNDLIQLITNDGRTVLVKEKKYSPGDSIEIELPNRKILNHLKFKKGARVVITGGKHAGEQSIVKEIKPATMESPELVILKAGSREFQTTSNNVFVIGEEK